MSAQIAPTTRAKKLVSYANVLAMASLDDDLLHLYPPLLYEFRSPSLIGRLVWDFFATVAGVGVAFAEIADTVPKAEQEALRYAIVDALTTWNRRGYNTLTDFSNFVRQGITSGAPQSALIGTWIIRNVLRDHRPATGDFDLFSNAGSAIGTVFLRAFNGWWQKKAPRRVRRGPADVPRALPRARAPHVLALTSIRQSAALSPGELSLGSGLESPGLCSGGGTAKVSATHN